MKASDNDALNSIAITISERLRPVILDALLNMNGGVLRRGRAEVSVMAAKQAAAKCRNMKTRERRGSKSSAVGERNDVQPGRGRSLSWWR